MNSSKNTLALLHPSYLLGWLGLGLLWLITRLPYRWQMSCGKKLGLLLYYLPSKLKNITEINLALCFPELSLEKRRELCKKNFASLGIGLIETAMAWWLSDEKLATLFHVSGFAFVEEAYAKGKGVILAGPHFTSLEMIARLLSTHYSFAIMYRPHKKRLLAYMHERFRPKTIHYIPRHRMRELIRCLNEKSAVWYAYDVDAGEKRSVFAPFFGIPTASLTSVSRLVELSGAVVIPISFYRRDDGTGYEIMLSAPLENFPGKDLIEDATRLNQTLEMGIRQKPEQYIWQYKRFKTRPAGEKRFY